MEDVRPYLPQGIKELRMPPLEPLLVQHAELDTGSAFKAVFDNINIYGLTNFIVKKINVDIDRNTLEVDLLFPFVRTTADYTIKGRLLILQLNGFGKSRGSYGEYTILFAINNVFVMRNFV